MNAESIIKSFKKELKGKITEARIDKRTHELKHTVNYERAWFTVGKDSLLGAIDHLKKISPDPHFAVCSGYELGENIEIIYHFSVNYDSKMGEVSVGMKVKISKSNPTIPTITELIPGALISEREIQEMLGVVVEGIPDPRRLFLDKDFPKGVYPLRKDETGPHKMIRDMHKGDNDGK